MAESTRIVAWLRAAGEPTRLRLLTLCRQRESSVSELALAVAQSGPRVSRHLKILCAAGLLSRLRCGQWVHYGLTQESAAARFVQAITADLDPAEPLLAGDRKRLRRGAIADEASAVRVRLDQALVAFMATSPVRVPAGGALVLGVEHLALLTRIIRSATDCTAVAFSPRQAQAARAYLKRERLNCRVVLAAEPLASAQIAAAQEPFATVVIDRCEIDAQGLEGLLEHIRGVLRADGQLWLFERYAALESPQPRATPLARLRQLLSTAGFACVRLSPIQVDRQHILAAAAMPALALGSASVA